MIQLERVSRHHSLGGETIKALDDVSLQISESDFVALMGPSGSGKSTFLNLIGGLDHPDSGEVRVDGVNIFKLSDRKIAKYRNQTIGFIFQSFNLQPAYTALENVMLPLYFSKVIRKQRRLRSQKALKLVGLEKRMNNKPHQLSGGEQQRVAIARALVNEPKILLADEPTGNLDSKNAKMIMQLLSTLHKEEGLTIAMVTHDQHMSEYASRVLHIRDGKIKI